MCVNGKWFNYDFKLVVPNFNLQVGKLEYNYDADYSQLYTFTNSEGKTEFETYGDSGYLLVDEDNYVLGQEQNNSFFPFFQWGEDKSLLFRSAMSDDNLVSVANSSFYKELYGGTNIQELADKYWQSVNIPNDFIY